MGFLTLVRISNDSVGDLKGNEVEFCKELTRYASTGGSGEISGLAKVFTSRHTHDIALYIQHGGEVYELTPGSNEAEHLFDKNSKYFEEVVSKLKGQVRALEAMLSLARTAKKLSKR